MIRNEGLHSAFFLFRQWKDNFRFFLSPPLSFCTTDSKNKTNFCLTKIDHDDSPVFFSYTPRLVDWQWSMIIGSIDHSIDISINFHFFMKILWKFFPRFSLINDQMSLVAVALSICTALHHLIMITWLDQSLSLSVLWPRHSTNTNVLFLSLHMNGWLYLKDYSEL